MKTAEQFKAEVLAALRAEQGHYEEWAEKAEKDNLMEMVNTYWDQFNAVGRCLTVVEDIPTA